MQNTKVAADMLRASLPVAWTSKIDFSTMEVQDTSLFSNDWQHFKCDILYKCQFSNNDGYILLLAEHQSSADKMMAFRLAHYRMHILMRHIDDEKLPNIIRWSSITVMNHHIRIVAICGIVLTIQSLQKI